MNYKIKDTLNTTEMMDHYLHTHHTKDWLVLRIVGVEFRNKKWINLTDRRARDFKVNHGK